MSYTALSLAQTPPLSVPLRYFLTAPLFLLLAGLLLLIEGPEALSSRWTPAMLALTHLVVLGFIAMVMFGAMQQLLAVLIGVPVSRSLLLSTIVHLFLSLGILALVLGLYWTVPFMLVCGAVSLGMAVIIFAAAASSSLFRSTSQHATALAMKLAVLGLVVTAALGIMQALGQAGYLPLQRYLTDIHLGWGLFVWIGLLLIGVAYQVVPMFQLTPNYPRHVIRYLVPVLFGLLLFWVFLYWIERGGQGGLEGVVAVGLAMGYSVFAAITLRLQAQRRRRLPDTTLRFWRLAMISLLLGVVAWILRRYLGLPVPAITLGLIFIMGFVIAAIIGMLFKIVPFLVWLHLNNRLQASAQWQGRIPNMKQIIIEQQARRQYRLYLVTLVVVLAASLWPEWLSHIAASLVIGTALLLWWHLFSALRIYLRVLAEGRGAVAEEM